MENKMNLININQAKSIEYGFENAQCVAIFIVIADLIERNKDGIELVEIARAVPFWDLETNTIRGYITKLEKKKVIVHDPNSKGKKHFIELTDLGKKYFEVKEKNPVNEISTLVENFIAEIAKKFFLLSEVGKNNPVKYNDELNNLIDSMVENGIYEIYFTKLRLFYYEKLHSNKFNKVEIDPHLIDLKDFILDYVKDPREFKAAMYNSMDASLVHQNNFNHLMDLISMFYREKYLNREI